MSDTIDDIHVPIQSTRIEGRQVSDLPFFFSFCSFICVSYVLDVLRTLIFLLGRFIHILLPPSSFLTFVLLVILKLLRFLCSLFHEVRLPFRFFLHDSNTTLPTHYTYKGVSISLLRTLYHSPLRFFYRSRSNIPWNIPYNQSMNLESFILLPGLPFIRKYRVIVQLEFISRETVIRKETRDKIRNLGGEDLTKSITLTSERTDSGGTRQADKTSRNRECKFYTLCDVIQMTLSQRSYTHGHETGRVTTRL